MNAVEVRELSVTLGGSHVLQGVTFDVPAGGVTALLGRNGVGKTTTLRALLGMVERRGEVRLLGTDTAGLATHRVVRLGVGYVPEDRDVFSGLSVEENLRLAEQRSDPLYDEVFALFPELKERARQRAGTLSGGQQQMVAIARVLLNGWPLLLVDEPSKGLAPLLVSDLADVLERVAERSTILLVEQNLALIKRLASRVIVLDHGEVIHTGSSAELADESLARRFLGVTSGA
ncbi:MAG TPA: ABC transporter ATP-binding protein [Acidimicrobiales bacterium]|nr:MAG: ABC transporter ATP-binding protein [Actinobacteria bacterium 21-64-8]HQT99182.1 ABC transporter ATP-binding protein [Acidimicrobiales bacterium]